MKYKIEYLNDILNSIIIEYELMIFESIKVWKKNMIALKIVIDEIVMKMRYKCIEYKYCILIWDLMMNYIMKNHENKNMREYMKVNIQI